MPFVHQAFHSLTSFLRCHVTDLLLPSLAGVIAAFYSSFSFCHIPGSDNPLASSLLISSSIDLSHLMQVFALLKELGTLSMVLWQQQHQLQKEERSVRSPRAFPLRPGSSRGGWPGAGPGNRSLCPT